MEAGGPTRGKQSLQTARSTLPPFDGGLERGRNVGSEVLHLKQSLVSRAARFSSGWLRKRGISLSSLLRRALMIIRQTLLRVRKTTRRHATHHSWAGAHAVTGTTGSELLDLKQSLVSRAARFFSESLRKRRISLSSRLGSSPQPKSDKKVAALLRQRAAFGGRCRCELSRTI